MLLQTHKIYGHSLYGQRVTVFTGLPSVTNLKGHEFVVWFWGPGVHLHTILQSNHQELYLLVAHYRKNIKEHMKQITSSRAASQIIAEIIIKLLQIHLEKLQSESLWAS